MKTTLVVDLNIALNGHKMGFMKELFRYIVSHPPKEKFCFLSNIPLGLPDTEDAINLIFDTPKDQKGTLAKYQEQFDLMVKIAKEQGAGRVILMELDLYQWALAKTNNTDLVIEGIWFRPFHRQKCVSNSLIDQFKFEINQLKKKFLIRNALRNKQLQGVYILNDQSGVQWYNQNHRKVFKYLPDPVFESHQKEDIDIKSYYKIPENKHIYLIFGWIDDRKNVTNILKAFALLPEGVQTQSAVLIVGKVADFYVEEVHKAMEESPAGLQVILRDEFVSDEHLETLFAQSQLVFRMNVNYFASSGVIGIAAKYNVPSLVSNYGLVEELTLEYELGKSVDPMNVDAIAAAIRDFDQNPDGWRINGQRYFESHNTQAFAKTLLGI